MLRRPEIRYALLSPDDAEAFTGYPRGELVDRGVETLTRSFADGRRAEALRVPIAFRHPGDARWAWRTLEAMPWLGTAERDPDIPAERGR